MITIYTIMIVEDDKTIRLELQVLLKNAGYEVYAVETFEDVIEQIKKVQPHMILMDVMLPIQSGLELCMKIRSFSQVPVLFVTNCNTTEDEMRCITMGGDDFVAKPYNVPILLGRIANVLRRTYGNEKESNLISHKGVVLNLETGELAYMEQSIELTWSELKILTCLFKKKGTFVSRVYCRVYSSIALTPTSEKSTSSLKYCSAFLITPKTRVCRPPSASSMCCRPATKSSALTSATTRP